MDSQCIACVENTRSDSCGDALVVQIIRNLVVVVGGGGGWRGSRKKLLLALVQNREEEGWTPGANEG